MPACCHGATVKITLKFQFFNFSKVNETKDLEGIGSSFLTAYALLVGFQFEIDSSFPDFAGTQNKEVPRIALTSFFLDAHCGISQTQKLVQ